ncbi:IS5 family transposase [Methylobacterium sp. CB376]|uniref:IS5 family transposase n=1 Tax=unclassified Methylobacterium TaxID=2615210 RepID=UPI000A2EFFA7|nr:MULTISPECIES: IS5 family transposase [Methylobacterium]WFT77806.1 IS5 family transposase [Methylobacterium nodulans]
MRHFELTDAQWERIAPLLPPQKPRTGRPAEDHRRVLNGLLWILRTGAPWEGLPTRYGPVGTVSSRLYRWRKAGVFDRVLRRLKAQADARGELDWDLHFVDATVVRAHQHAAGARRLGALGGEGTVEGMGEALGCSQGGFSTKLHLRAEGHGKPIAAVLTAGERHEQFALDALDALMDKGAVRRRGCSRPRLRPRRAAGDRGYSSPPARRRLKQRRVEPVIPTRRDRPRQPHFDTAAYRERNKVERLINRLKQYRRIATRYEKRAANGTPPVSRTPLIRS